MTKTFIYSILGLILLMAGAGSTPVAAQGSGPSKIGYVDIEEVTKNANFIKNMLGGIEATAAERQKSLEAKQDEYERIRKEIQAKSAVAGESEQEALRKQARDILNQIDEETYQLNNYLKRVEKEKMDPALDRVLEVVKAIGSEEGFDLILRAETVLYGSGAANITDKVVARLNRDAVSEGNAASAVPPKTEAAKNESPAKETPAASQNRAPAARSR